MNVRVVARTRWQLALRGFVPRAGGPRGMVIRALLSSAAAALIPAILWLGLAGLFDLLKTEGATAAESAMALALAFNAALVVLLVSDLHATVAMLLTDPDLELLRRAPMGPRQVLFLKLADSIPQTTAGLLLIAVPATLAYHAIYPLPAWAWVLFAALLVGMWAVPLALGTTAALWVLARIPGRRAREALGAITAFMLFFVWLGSVMLSLEGQDDRALMDNLRGTLGQIPALYRHGPAGWAANALGAATEGRYAEAFANAGWLALTAAAAIAFATAVAARSLETVQSKIRGAGPTRRATTPRARRDRAPRAAAVAREGGVRPSAMHVVKALATRDARLFLRDWPVLSDVVIAAILWSLLPVLWSSMFGEHETTLARAMFLALAVGLGNEVAGRAVPIERRGLAWTRLAPLPPAVWIAGKLVVSGAASLLVLTLAAVITIAALGLGGWTGLGVFASTMPALVLATVLGLWLGATFGRADWTNPRGMLTQGGRLVAAVVMIVQVGAWWGWAAAFERREIAGFASVAWGLPIVAMLLVVVALMALSRQVRAGLGA